MSRPSTPMVKLKPQTHARLQEISRQDNKPMGEIITELVERYERERFWRGEHKDLARLREDPVKWRSYRAESDEWDTTAGVGLDNEPAYAEGEE